MVRLKVVNGIEIGLFRVWFGGFCFLRLIGDMDVGDYIVVVFYVK